MNKTAIFKYHNIKRVEDIKKLISYYDFMKCLDNYQRKLFFWLYGYLFLIFKGNPQKARFELEKAFEPYATTIHPNDAKRMMESIEKRYAEKNPYTLSNEGFVKNFPVAKMLHLDTSNVTSEKERSRLRRLVNKLEKIEKGEDKESKIEKRRQKVLFYRGQGVKEKDIAKKLNVSLSTIEKDINAIKSEMESLYKKIYKAVTVFNINQAKRIIRKYFKKRKKTRRDIVWTQKQDILSQRLLC